MNIEMSFIIMIRRIDIRKVSNTILIKFYHLNAVIFRILVFYGLQIKLLDDLFIYLIIFENINIVLMCVGVEFIPNLI